MFKSMGAQKYLTDRVEQFIGWYNKRAVSQKRWFLFLRTTSVIASLVAREELIFQAILS